MSAENKDIFDRIMLLPGLRLFNGFYRKNKSVLLYIFFGGLTTLISIGSFVLLDSWLGIHTLIANILSWVCAVLFAYVTNRVWVFASKATGMQIVREMISFFAGRLITLGLEEVLLFVFVAVLHFNSTVIKVLGQIIVLVLNYLISKLLVFRKRRKDDV